MAEFVEEVPPREASYVIKFTRTEILLLRDIFLNWCQRCVTPEASCRCISNQTWKPRQHLRESIARALALAPAEEGVDDDFTDRWED